LILIKLKRMMRNNPGVVSGRRECATFQVVLMEGFGLNLEELKSELEKERLRNAALVEEIARLKDQQLRQVRKKVMVATKVNS
jgi:hypothetical protein